MQIQLLGADHDLSPRIWSIAFETKWLIDRIWAARRWVLRDSIIRQ